MKRDNRDSLDFATMNISTLYGKILFPTLIGMVASVVNIVADGAFKEMALFLPFRPSTSASAALRASHAPARFLAARLQEM